MSQRIKNMTLVLLAIMAIASASAPAHHWEKSHNAKTETHCPACGLEFGARISTGVSLSYQIQTETQTIPYSFTLNTGYTFHLLKPPILSSEYVLTAI